MVDRVLPPLEFLRERFDYDPKTGVVKWRPRSVAEFPLRRIGLTWNTRYAGGQGNADSDGRLRFRLEFEGKSYCVYAHVVAYALHHGTVDFPEIDHADVDPGNNRPWNLRPATRAQNNINRKGWSGLPKGVFKVGQRYRASATVDSKTRQIGTFATIEEAHAAFCAFSKPLRGAFFNRGAENVFE